MFQPTVYRIQNNSKVFPRDLLNYLGSKWGGGGQLVHFNETEDDWIPCIIISK